MSMKVPVIMLLLLLMSMTVFAFEVHLVRAAIIVPDDYPTIQEAINAAGYGDKIFIRNGTYYGPLNIGKTISLIGESNKNTIIAMNDSIEISCVITITANNVQIRNLNISTTSRFQYMWTKVGICVSGGNHSLISDCSFKQFYITLLGSHYDTIISNFINAESAGIGLYSSNNATIIENTLSLIVPRRSSYGVFLQKSNGTVVYHNNFIQTIADFEVEDSYDNRWDDGYPSGGNYHWGISEPDLYSGPYQNETGSDGIVDVPYPDFSGGWDRYPLVEPLPFPTLKTIGMRKNIDPTRLNLKSKLEWITAYIEEENFDLNEINVSTITLNNAVPVDLTVPPCLGDFDNDSVADLMVKFNRTAVCEFILSQGVTTGNVKLTIRWQLNNGTALADSTIITARMPGDVNVDGKVDGKDLALVSKSFNSYPGYPRWNFSVDENEDNKIDGKDIATIAKNYGKTYI